MRSNDVRQRGAKQVVAGGQNGHDSNPEGGSTSSRKDPRIHDRIISKKWLLAALFTALLLIVYSIPDIRSQASDPRLKGSEAAIQILSLRDINPQVVALARKNAREIFNQRPRYYRQTHPGSKAGFCSQVVTLSIAYTVGLWTGRPLAINKDPRQPRSNPYNCPSDAGIQCFFNTSGIMIDHNDLQKPSLFETPVCWNKKYKGTGNRFPRDEFGLPLYYSRYAPLCHNVPFFAKNSFVSGSQSIKMAPRGTSPSTWIQAPPIPMVQLSICLMWNLNDDVQAEVDKVKKALGLKRPYAAIHIRRGDKADLKEDARTINALEYLKHIPKDTKEIFIATDAMESLEEAKAAVKELNLTETIKLHPSFFGRSFHKEEQATLILNKTLEDNFREAVELLTEIDMLADADVFVGTGSSNVGAVVAALRACRGHSVESSISVEMTFERQLQY